MTVECYDWRDVGCPECEASPYCKIVGYDMEQASCGDPHFCDLDRDHDGPHVCEGCGAEYDGVPHPPGRAVFLVPNVNGSHGSLR